MKEDKANLKEDKKKIDRALEKILHREIKPLQVNERLVLLLIIAHIMIFVSIALLNIILREVNELIRLIIEFIYLTDKLMKALANLGRS